MGYRRVSVSTGTSTARSKKKADPFYKSRGWLSLRAKVIRRDQSTCTICGKVLAKGRAQVDHIVSRAAAPERALDPSNTVTMCWSCHSSKTCRRDGGFGRAPQAEPTGCNTEGEVFGPGHPWYAGDR